MIFMTTDRMGRTKRAWLEERVFDILCEHPYGLYGRELENKLYSDREDGGPDYARDSMAVAIWRLNKRLKAHGLKLHVHAQCGVGSKYRIWIRR